jgi:Protein of unknown function (DUF1236)
MRSQIFAAASAAVLSIALGVSCAYAGATSNEGGPANAGNPSAAQPAPNAAPAAPNAQDGGPGAQGAMPGKAEDKSAAQPSVEGAQTDERSGEKSDQAPKGAAKPIDDRDGKSAEHGKDERAGDRGRDAAETKDRPGDKSAEGQHKDEGSSTRDDKDGTTAESRDEKDGKGDRKRAQFEPRDKEKVKTYFSQHKPNVKRVDRDRVSVSIGVAIPGSIALYPLPAGVVVVADCPLQYFLWGDDLVIVDSCSREVVDIVPNIG